MRLVYFEFNIVFLNYFHILSSACLGSFGCGTGLAWSSPVLPRVDHDQCLDDCDISDVSASVASWIGPVFPLGAVFAGPMAFYLLEKIGRKRTLIALSFPMLIGYIMLTFSKTADSIALLLAGRFLCGGSTSNKYLNVAE
jgi:MFS family permease